MSANKCTCLLVFCFADAGVAELGMPIQLGSFWRVKESCQLILESFEIQSKKYNATRISEDNYVYRSKVAVCALTDQIVRRNHANDSKVLNGVWKQYKRAHMSRLPRNVLKVAIRSNCWSLKGEYCDPFAEGDALQTLGSRIPLRPGHTRPFLDVYLMFFVDERTGDWLRREIDYLVFDLACSTALHSCQQAIATPGSATANTLLLQSERHSRRLSMARGKY